MSGVYRDPAFLFGWADPTPPDDQSTRGDMAAAPRRADSIDNRVWSRQESVERLIEPVQIAFDQALLVAVVGLLVNGLSVWILGVESGHTHDQHHESGAGDAIDHHSDSHDHDHNLRAAYLHVLADALTSLLAIVALLAGKYLGLNWLDPVMGIVGAALVAKWSIGLLRTTSRILLDQQGPSGLRAAIAARIESLGDEVADMHLWAIAPGRYSLILSIVTDSARSRVDYREALPQDTRLAHITIEVWQRD